MVHVTETGFEVLTLAPGETGAKANIPNAMPAGVEPSAAPSAASVSGRLSP
jgi:methionyl aminopeptidase